MTGAAQVIALHPRGDATDPRASALRTAVARHLRRGDEPAQPAPGVRVYRLFATTHAGDPEALRAFARAALADPLVDEVLVASHIGHDLAGSYVHLARLPGLTDDEARSAELSWALLAGEEPVEWTFFTQELVVFDAVLPNATLAGLARDVLGNPNVHALTWGPLPFVAERPRSVALTAKAHVDEVPLPDTDAGLLELSRGRQLGLSLAELRAIKAHLADADVRARRLAAGFGAAPTDCELEIFAQTWSEHCKHKEFNATIEVDDRERGQHRVVRSLFKSYVSGPTREVCASLEARGQGFVVVVFDDNAGVVRVNPTHNLTLKVETHNSPSALDPYGGAITGILGCNRDAIGTGRGGGRLYFNTDVLCFGPPAYGAPLLPGQLHPARVFEGVHAGVRDGGNKSGVPTVNGALVFDDRFAGKPLVFCGSAALVPASIELPEGPAPAWKKDVRPGDLVVTVGGRVGQDGIHGATFSSHELAEGQSRGVVQVGSPFTQKLVVDFLEEAAARGLVSGVNDSGAGGLSSSAGELARLTGGVRIHTDRVPLKYPGLLPWEIFLSESQERMTLAVRPEHERALVELARSRGVLAQAIGEFTDTGLLEVLHGELRVARLGLEFLHEGAPPLSLSAVVLAPTRSPARARAHEADLGALLLEVLASPNVCSREAVVRGYDHEVKGKTVVKPYMGERGRAPQDAAVLRVDHDGHEGIAVASGICPRYGDLDPFAMAQGAFDEAVRSLISVGARLPGEAEGPFELFCGCDNFCVPDSVFHPENNPDGREKLGKLVRIAEGLAEMVRAFEVPMVSGKDSMKNDLRAGGRKISVPPTLLVTMVAKIRDVRRAVTSEWKQPGDVVFLVGETHDELGRSIALGLLGDDGGVAPVVRLADTRALYTLMTQAHARGLLASSHDLSDGGLGAALAEACIGSGLGAVVQSGADELPALAALFAESHARFVVTVPPEREPEAAALFGARARRLGVVGGAELVVRWRDTERVRLSVDALTSAYETRLA